LTLLLAALIAAALVTLSCLIAYAVFRRAWQLMIAAGATRARILYAILAAFLVHFIGIALYGGVYFLGEPALGSLRDATPGETVETIDLIASLYFSGVTYSSIGFGDIVPLGDLRLIAIVEGLNGLVLVGWTVAYSFVAMDEFWDKPVRPQSQ
jgi:hypothetical protein